MLIFSAPDFGRVLFQKKIAVIIKTSHTKDIRFKASERRKAASFVKTLLKKGWDLHTGEVINDDVFGDLSLKAFWLDGESTEEIQLHKLEFSKTEIRNI